MLFQPEARRIEQAPLFRKLLTPPGVAFEKGHKGLGVGVFILNKEGKILIVKENKTKDITERKPNEYGVPCETVQYEENGEMFEEAVLRGLSEELGIPVERVGKLFRIDPKTCYRGEGMISNWYSRVFEVHFVGTAADLMTHPVDNEVEIEGWFNPEELHQRFPLRNATKTILASHAPSILKPGHSKPLMSLSVLGLLRAEMKVWED
ncbi:MAG: NUDIX hydrolase [Patescibacteria group bacterium]